MISKKFIRQLLLALVVSFGVTAPVSLQMTQVFAAAPSKTKIKAKPKAAAPAKKVVAKKVKTKQVSKAKVAKTKPVAAKVKPEKAAKHNPSKLSKGSKKKDVAKTKDVAKAKDAAKPKDVAKIKDTAKPKDVAKTKDAAKPKKPKAEEEPLVAEDTEVETPAVAEPLPPPVMLEPEHAEDGGSMIAAIFILAIGVLVLASGWKIFEKIGRPGWAAVVPIYNAMIVMQVVSKPSWWAFLFLVPGLNIYIAIVTIIPFVKLFGKERNFGFGVIFLSPIFMPLLAFGDAQYVGAGVPNPGGFDSAARPAA